MIKLAAYQPDIATNLGSMIRLTACMGIPLEVIEPCGFPFSLKALRRSAMDYAEFADINRHDDWQAFLNWKAAQNKNASNRLVLLTTKTDLPYTDFSFQETDILMVGRESAGVPETVHAAADAHVTIPMPGGGRSLNVAVSAAMVVGEAMRQLRR